MDHLHQRIAQRDAETRALRTGAATIALLDADAARSLSPWRLVARFRVFGEPKGQPRPRAFATRIGGKVTARVFEAGTAEGWKSAVALASEPQRPSSPLEGPIRVDLELLLPRPKALMRKKDPEGRIYAIKKPDVDNAMKSTFDAMTQLGWWRDDAQICAGETTKLYHAKNETAGAIVTVSVIGDIP